MVLRQSLDSGRVAGSRVDISYLVEITDCPHVSHCRIPFSLETECSSACLVLLGAVGRDQDLPWARRTFRDEVGLEVHAFERIEVRHELALNAERLLVLDP